MDVVTWIKGLCEMPREYNEIPVALRAARYPNGGVRIQGEYVWCEGLRTGTTWKDLPLVNVDRHGVEK